MMTSKIPRLAGGLPAHGFTRCLMRKWKQLEAALLRGAVEVANGMRRE